MKEQPRKGRFSNGNVKIDSLHVLKAIIDEDEDMVRLMNLNVKLREAA